MDVLLPFGSHPNMPISHDEAIAGQQVLVAVAQADEELHPRERRAFKAAIRESASVTKGSSRMSRQTSATTARTIEIVFLTAAAERRLGPRGPSTRRRRSS